MEEERRVLLTVGVCPQRMAVPLEELALVKDMDKCLPMVEVPIPLLTQEEGSLLHTEAWVVRLVLKILLTRLLRITTTLPTVSTLENHSLSSLLQTKNDFNALCV